MASLDILLEVGGITLDEDAKLALAEKKNAWYVEYISNMDESEILPGAREFIQALKDRGIKVALGSASKNAMLILNNTGLTPYFDAIIDGTKTAQAKPDPEVFTLGAESLAPGLTTASYSRMQRPASKPPSARECGASASDRLKPWGAPTSFFPPWKDLRWIVCWSCKRIATHAYGIR